MKNPNFVKMKKNVNIRRRETEFDGPKETIEEFLARGGKITICPPRLAPDIEAGDPPRLPYTGWKMYN